MIELLRPQVADDSATDVCQVVIESCNFKRRSSGMLDVLIHWLCPWNDPSKWQLLQQKCEAYTVETFIAAEHCKGTHAFILNLISTRTFFQKIYIYRTVNLEGFRREDKLQTSHFDDHRIDSGNVALSLVRAKRFCQLNS